MITATLISEYHLCLRRLWLHAKEVRMEHTSELVSEGKYIGETSYAQRSTKYTELALDGIKIDYYDARNKVVHEVKKSNKAEYAHEAQVKYYLYKLHLMGIEATGILEYPKLRETKQVVLTEADKITIPHWEEHITTILAQECPNAVKKSICRNCSYNEFCWV